MSQGAAQLKAETAEALRSGARVIDIRTRRAWSPPVLAPVGPAPFSAGMIALIFLADMALTFSLVALGAWLFVKMQGG